jgi:hypothetical protein
MQERLTLILSTLERKALQEAAQADMRDLRGQARFIIREGLQMRGLLQDGQTSEPKSMGAVGINGAES